MSSFTHHAAGASGHGGFMHPRKKLFFIAFAILLAATSVLGITTLAKYTTQDKVGSAGVVISNVPAKFDL